MRRLHLHEGMRVYDSLDRPVGRVHTIVHGQTSRAPRFLAVDVEGLGHGRRLVPCEAIERATSDDDIRLALTKPQVEMLPRHHDRAPTAEEARHAYTMLGGLQDDPASGEDAHTVPFEDSLTARNVRTDARLEIYVLIEEDARPHGGYRDDWTIGGGPGP